MKKVLSIVLSIILLSVIVPIGTIGADAAEDDIVEIRTIADLYNINNNMGGNYKLMNDIDMTEDTAVGDDWDFMGNGWEPIGSDGIYSNIPFTGTFDGNGHKIIGMRIEANTLPSGTNTIHLGLFAHNSGIIKNLGVDETSVVKYGDYSGSICAYNSGTILNCYNKADLSLGDCSGGICGYSHNGSILNCYNVGNVSSDYYSGGICAYSTQCVVSECNNSGTVSALSVFSNINLDDKIASFSGGICGYSSGNTIENSYNTKNISASTYISSVSSKGLYYKYSGLSTKSYYGVTFHQGEIKAVPDYINDYYFTRVSSEEAFLYFNDIHSYSGGICGYLIEGTITNCYNTNDIAANVSTPYSSSGSYSGGIAGEASADTISYCYNVGEADYCICGNSLNKVLGCYYLSTSSKNNTGAKALTSAQLQLEICMPNFDFESTWVIDKATEYKYPQLINNRQETAKPNLLGDADGDGDITILDVTVIQRVLAEMTPSVYYADLADVDNDGAVTVIDATWIGRYLAQQNCPDGINKPITK